MTNSIGAFIFLAALILAIFVYFKYVAKSSQPPKTDDSEAAPYKIESVLESNKTTEESTP